MKRRGTRAGIVIETLLILAALGLLGKAIVTAGATYKFTHLAEPADGIVNVVDDKDLGLNIQFPTASGKTIVFVQNGFFPGYEAGQHVAVLYDPNDPEMAAMEGFNALWSKPLLMAVPGFFLLLFGLRLHSERSL